MTEKTVKRIVAHPNLYFRVEGKLERVKVGTELHVTEKQAKSLGSKVVDPAKKQLVDGKLVDNSDDSALAGQLAKAQDEIAALKKAEGESAKSSQELAKQLATAQDEVKKLKAKKG